jgi:hypothetical protein
MTSLAAPLRKPVAQLYRDTLSKDIANEVRLAQESENIDNDRSDRHWKRADAMTKTLAAFNEREGRRNREAVEASENEETAQALLKAHEYLNRFGRPGDVLELDRLLAAAERTGGEVIHYEYPDDAGEDQEDGDGGPTSLAFAIATNLEDEFVVESLLKLDIGAHYDLGGGAAPHLIVRRLS